MNKNYELPKIEIILFQEEIVSTSSTTGPSYSGDSEDDWGNDIWD